MEGGLAECLPLSTRCTDNAASKYFPVLCCAMKKNKGGFERLLVSAHGAFLYCDGFSTTPYEYNVTMSRRSESHQAVGP
jgi:hypothetical protein